MQHCFAKCKAGVQAQLFAGLIGLDFYATFLEVEGASSPPVEELKRSDHGQMWQSVAQPRPEFGAKQCAQTQAESFLVPQIRRLIEA